mgnify:CR=1 FL=1
MNNNVRLGICGLGRFGKNRLVPALKKIDNIELKSFVRGNYLDAVEFKNLNDLLTTQSCDLIHITSPNAMHYYQSLQCLEASTNVICEKPLSISSLHSKQLLQKAQEKNCHLFVGHMLRSSPVIKKFKEMLYCRTIGSIEQIRINFFYSIDANKRKWVWNREISGGGCVIDSGIHCFDLLHYLFEQDIILHNCTLQKNEFNIETSASIEGAIGETSCIFNLNANAEYESSLFIKGSKTNIKIENFGATWGTSKILVINPETNKTENTIEIDVSSVYEEQYRKIIKLILNNKFDYSMALDAIRNLILIEDIYSCA